MATSQPAPPFYVRHVPVYGKLILAPMAGFSDLPFRSLCRELGSAMSYTEFINAMEVIQGAQRVQQQLAYWPSERPVVFQIFDHNPRRLLEAGLRLQELGPDIIDINMGCSVRRVSGRGAGAGLLRSPQKVAQIFHLLSKNLEVPVSGKIRLGWDNDSLNYLLIARIIEENGGALLAVHGRTKAQGYTGEADWDAIAEIKNQVSIPVIGNGDVSTVAQADQMIYVTGCDGVMIGRGAVGNPWIFSRLDRNEVEPNLVRQTLLRHLERMLAYYGHEKGLILFRKHLSQYISPYPLTKNQRRRLLTTETPQEILRIFDSLLSFT